ncbi:M23 family metallopeptidase [Salinarimonas rosea]|uniref:M23 family metallopeptidase n=1 Tax=Salinarimonas rosea TaxID=552063 RepID=UPI00040483C3|nr:M23 family metallopeptidase [Salinarimonas rosea]
MHDGRGRLRGERLSHDHVVRERDLVPRASAPPRTLFAVGPFAAAALGVVLTLLTAWAAGATWYIASREDLVAELLRRQALTEARYEDHLGALRARLDRVASRKLIDQDTMEQRVASLVSRQVEVETRQAVLADLAQRIAPAAVTGAIAGAAVLPDAASAFAPLASPPARPEDLAPQTRPRPEPRPAPGPFELRLRGDATGETAVERAATLALPAAASVGANLDAAERSLSVVEEGQIRALERIRLQVELEAGIMRDAIETAGLDPYALEPAHPDVLAAEGIGGPFIPIGIDAEAGGFEARVAELQESLVARDRLRRTTITIPFERPVDGDIAVTSNFGVRSDPFTRRPAFHAGIDFRARTGEPVYATAAGRIVAAGRAGGYGKLVEIDHGNGLTTRFAHLSAITVSDGAEVAAGDLIGRAGSSGRSTGPHLHYETRLDGRAVDPWRFLRAAEVLAELKGGLSPDATR